MGCGQELPGPVPLTGDLQALAKLRDRVTAGLVDVMRVPGLGPKTARRLFTELGIACAGIG